MSNVIEVNGDLSKWVNPREKRLVVIDFFATWCGPCKYMHPIFDDFSVRYKNVVFLRVDSDKNRHLSGEYGVTGLPTFVFVLQGTEVDRVTGADANAVERNIQKYESAGSGFQGKGMALGGSSSASVNAREMRLKKFGGIKMSAASTSSHMNSMLNKMLSKEDSDGDEEEEEVVAEEKDKAASQSSESTASLRDTLLSMGFTAAQVDQTLRECPSRDLTDLVVYITALPAPADADSRGDAPHVECDGTQCRLVPSNSSGVSSNSSGVSSNSSNSADFQSRVEEMRAKIQQRREEKAREEKAREKAREKERIERGKLDQLQRAELERTQRQREVEKERREKIAAEKERQRQLELWRKDHGITAEQQQAKIPAEKTPEERAQLLVASLMLQTAGNAGRRALNTVRAILQNAGKEDPKYRQIRRDNALLQKNVVSVPGALALLQLGGFEVEGELLVMKEFDAEKVSVVLGCMPSM